jgi:hypothetical protein
MIGLHPRFLSGETQRSGGQVRTWQARSALGATVGGLAATGDPNPPPPQKRSRRVEESKALSTDGESDESRRRARDIFVRQSPTESDESASRATLHPPRMSDESDSVWATGRDTRVEPRDESNTTASARGGQESRSRRRHVEPQPKGVYCRTPVGATRRLVATTLQSKSDRV